MTTARTSRTRPLRLATRGSELARAQADRVAQAVGVECELVVVTTTGDARRDEPIWTMGGRGVFVKEVQEAVLDGRADVAVHSAKDLPSTTPDGLVIAAFPERLDPRDALVGARLEDLPTGATVATGSVRRRVQLAALRPDLSFASLRGNIATRLDKARAFGAAVVSAAALERLGLTDRADELLDPSVMLPQVGQGALAVECRDDALDVRGVLDAVDAPDVRRAVTAERAFLAQLGGGCSLPVGALAQVDGDGTVHLEVLLASLDGRVVLRHACEGSDPERVGAEAGVELVEGRGGRMLLDAGVVG